MQITFINVGYGDAILVQQPGFTLLLDGGSALPEEFAGNADRIPAVDYLKAQGIAQIDLLVVSHIHEDHVCGLEAIAREIPIREIMLPLDPALFAGAKELTPRPDAPRSVHLFTAALNTMSRLVAKADAGHIPVKSLRSGDILQLPDALVVRVLAPVYEVREKFEALMQQAFGATDPTDILAELDRTSNHTSLLLSVESDGMGCLLAGDICPDHWDGFDFSLLEIENALKLPHHGQKDSISEEIYAKMPLKAVVTTASSDHRYNSANPAVYEALRRLHPEVELLFIDEREYPPYFVSPQGSQAIQLVMDSGEVRTEFIKITKKEISV